MKKTKKFKENRPENYHVHDTPSTGARYPGHCAAPIKGVYHEGFGEGDCDILLPHGCYVYRLLHGLNICGENTNVTFAQLLKRCKNGNNNPACPVVATLASEDEVRTLHSTACSGLTFFFPKQIMDDIPPQDASSQAPPEADQSVITIDSSGQEDVSSLCHSLFPHSLTRFLFNFRRRY